jgi:hypothetical protein
MKLWIPAIGIALCAVAACDPAPQKPKTSQGVISTDFNPAPPTLQERQGLRRGVLDSAADPRGMGRTTGADSVRLHGPGVNRRLQTRT